MRFIKKIFISAFMLSALGGGICIQSHAQSLKYGKDISPSNVYQSTETLKSHLDALGFLDKDLYANEPLDTALHHPRHVMQKVAECHIVIGKLLQEKQITIAPMPEIYSLREIRPADVKAGVDHLLKQIAKLGVPHDATIAPLVEGKVPSDVYNNLKRICHAVKSEIVPADVYRVANAVADNMAEIFKRRGYDSDLPVEESFSGKIPADVYQETWTFLIDLRTLALKPDYAIPGGVVIPDKQLKGEIIPQDVIALMGDAFAETSALKYALHIREGKALAAPDPSMQPSDVFGKIRHAHLIVNRLVELEDASSEEGAE